MANNMTGAYLPPSKTHEHEVKVRLTEDGDSELRRVAAQLDLKPAVLSRLLIVRGLQLFKQGTFGAAANGLFSLDACMQDRLRHG